MLGHANSQTTSEYIGEGLDLADHAVDYNQVQIDEWPDYRSFFSQWSFSGLFKDQWQAELSATIRVSNHS